MHLPLLQTHPPKILQHKVIANLNQIQIKQKILIQYSVHPAYQRTTKLNMLNKTCLMILRAIIIQLKQVLSHRTTNLI